MSSTTAISSVEVPDLLWSLNQEIGGLPSIRRRAIPSQPTFNYRGFSASPLRAGRRPAVYVNGMRFNPALRRHGGLGPDPNNAIDRLDVGKGPIRCSGLNALGARSTSR
jgi:hypothetical protein